MKTRSFALAQIRRPELTDEMAIEDMADWRAFLKGIKSAFDGKTYAELVGSDLDGALAEPLGQGDLSQS